MSVPCNLIPADQKPAAPGPGEAGGIRLQRRCRHWIIRQPKSRCGGCWYISCRAGDSGRRWPAFRAGRICVRCVLRCSSNIKNPALAAALQDFTDDCYHALYDWKAKRSGKTQDEKKNVTGYHLDRPGHLYERGISSDPVHTDTAGGLSLDAGGMTGMRNVNGNGYPTWLSVVE